MARSFLSYLRDERNRTLYGKYLKENPDPDVNIGRQNSFLEFGSCLRIWV